MLDEIVAAIFVLYFRFGNVIPGKLAQARLEVPWDEIVRDLSALRAVTVDLGAEQYLLRSPLQGSAGKILAAVGIKPPPLAQPASR